LHSKGVTPDDIKADQDMIDLIASLKYLRANYVHFASSEQYLYEALSPKLIICHPLKCHPPFESISFRIAQV